MNRREALTRVALLLGGTISAPLIKAALSGCQPKDPWLPQTLTAEQNELVTHLAEMILPETDTPGARSARVNRFIDMMLTDWYDENDRHRFLAGLADLETTSQKILGQPFLRASTAQQHELLQPLDAAAVAAHQAEEKELPFFAMMKELTLVGFFSSEIGIRQALHYDPTPGFFNGCLPLSEVGRAWA